MWGNSYYYDMKTGDNVIFNNIDVKLLRIENHFNLIKVGADTLDIKVSRRSLPVEVKGIKIFIADNRNIKKLSSDTLMHGLLNNDALICICEKDKPFLDPGSFVYPVSFNDGFQWSAEEDSYMFSWQMNDPPQKNKIGSYPGIGIDLNDAKGLEKHWITAVENSREIWVSDEVDGMDNSICLLLESQSHPGIYYVYNKMFNKNINVRKGRKIVAGDLIGTAWGDKKWGHLQFAIIKSDTVPDFPFVNIINGFPQLYGLYNRNIFDQVRIYTKGRILFGKPPEMCGNKKNTQAYEDYDGKGWIIGKWNIADKVESVNNDSDGNVRLKKILFQATPAECKNPADYYDYEISVPNGTYRIRARAGDISLPTKQKIEFEGVKPVTLSLAEGEFNWTTERIVNVFDGRLTIRIYIDHENKFAAGLSEIVFQRAN